MFFADVLGKEVKVDKVLCFLRVFRVSRMPPLMLILIPTKRLFKLVVITLKLLVFSRFFQWGQPFGCCSLTEINYRASLRRNHTFPFQLAGTNFALLVILQVDFGGPGGDHRASIVNLRAAGTLIRARKRLPFQDGRSLQILQVYLNHGVTKDGRIGVFSQFFGGV